MEMIDKLRDTAQSHDRCSVVEVMGRRAGYLALNVGIACGATSIIVPEIPFDFEKDIIERMFATSATGKKHFIIIVAEGVGHVIEMSEKIQARTGIETRATILGHVQRGGSPSLRDRVLASEMAITPSSSCSTARATGGHHPERSHSGLRHRGSTANEKALRFRALPHGPRNFHLIPKAGGPQGRRLFCDRRAG